MVLNFFRRKKKDEPEETVEAAQEAQAPVEEGAEETERRKSWMQKLRDGLSSTRDKVSGKINTIKAARAGIDEDFYEDILEVLLETDMGMEAAEEIVKKLRREVGARGAENTEEACDLLTEVIGRELHRYESKFDKDEFTKDQPGVVLLTGVNGSGKTTVCGKLAKRFKNNGYKVLLVAADTFRAAAIDQLKIWAERAEVDFQGAPEGKDPSSVVYDGLARARKENIDIVIVDTAGRLQNKVNLMNELGKIRRTVDKQIPGKNVQSLLVIDSTTGQNAITQAEVFGEVAKLDGIVLTKIDGTARGGVVLTINSRMKLPVVEIGVGEGIDDLIPFDPPVYARSLLGDIAGDEINWRWRVGTID